MQTRLLLHSLVLALATGAFAAACGPDLDDDAGAGADADGPPAADEPIGDDVTDLPDLEPSNGCGVDCDDIPADPQVIEVEPDGDAGADDADADDGGDDVISADNPAVIASGGPVAGSKMTVKRYAGLHAHASADSALLSAAPHGGVADDSLHPYRNPTGIIPGGKSVTVVDPTLHSGFMKVKYAGVTGWVTNSKLAFRPSSQSRLAFAKQASVRNAFFKHQIHRSMWNKDGPMHSGNCAPTSLAMAVAVFGKETSTQSVEQSIHRMRHVYDPGLHEGNGTTRSEIRDAAVAAGLHVHVLSSDVSPSAGLTRLNGQLSSGRAVVLTGEPGKPNSGPSLYEQAFNRAYAAAIADGAELPHSHYDFNGHHAILVLGRDGNGKYIVGDPLSEVGFITLTANEMKDFMTRWSGQRGTGVAVWP
jgi:hypothetical protein